ncbi:CDAN1-interacting nuclease 1-like [Lutzomyia longipalpis]|uniref:CDAN1-interacting nuclease 1-like n=1 Tax=Lutzomyia longipalpis TaxID=7200 RepID=UPI002483B8F8|nr:CDAN1-interacting nuclease 1-like [Lutzomyia longipalpis]
MVVIAVDKYNEIVKFIRNFRGLMIDCERELQKTFPEFSEYPIVLSSIISREVQTQLKTTYYHIQAQSSTILQQYESEIAENPNDDSILLNKSIDVKFSPVGLARLLLTEKYKGSKTKGDISNMVKSPYLIPDMALAANVRKCLFNDSYDGPLTDLIRRFIGEEYEIRLKEMAKKVGLVFHDEGDLRRTGYDKTPDLKLVVPCLYRGIPIHWIESKALFGDVSNHEKYVREQLSCYQNRFGAGIVIYWMGYIESLDRDENIFVRDSFPDPSELTLLKV